MEFSLLVVTRNRKEDLRRTLRRAYEWLPVDGEILVFDDASTDGTRGELSQEFPEVRWFGAETPVGGSGARRQLFSHARGRLVLGLDDDAEFLNPDVCDLVRDYFAAHKRCGIITCRIFWGRELPAPADNLLAPAGEAFACRDFLACGYAIRADCYAQSGGYPTWMNIYGEETCVALGAYRAGWETHYVPSVVVHHRVDHSARKEAGRGVFWFRNQLANSLGFAVVYYPVGEVPRYFARVLWHNLRKYALGLGMAVPFLQGLAQFMRMLPVLLKERKPLPGPQFAAWSRLPAPVIFAEPAAMACSSSEGTTE